MSQAWDLGRFRADSSRSAHCKTSLSFQPKSGGDRLPVYSRGQLSTSNTVWARSLVQADIHIRPADIHSEEPQCLPGEGRFSWDPCFAGLRCKGGGSRSLQQPRAPQNSFFPVLTLKLTSIHLLIDNYSECLLCARLCSDGFNPSKDKKIIYVGYYSAFRDKAQRCSVNCLRSHSSRVEWSDTETRAPPMLSSLP